MAFKIILSLIIGFTSAFGFGLVVNIPHRALLATGVTGSLSWTVYWYLDSVMGLNELAANLVGALIIGSMGILIAKRIKVIKNAIYVPALINLVPGKAAYLVVKNVIGGNYTAANSYFFQTMAIAIALAAGLFFCAFVERLAENLGQKRKI